MQMTFIEPPIEKREPKPVVTIWYQKGERLPRIYEQTDVPIGDPKKVAMNMLIAAASWGGRKPKPTKWERDQFGILYSIAHASLGFFKAEITQETDDV